MYNIKLGSRPGSPLNFEVGGILDVFDNVAYACASIEGRFGDNFWVLDSVLELTAVWALQSKIGILPKSCLSLAF